MFLSGEQSRTAYFAVTSEIEKYEDSIRKALDPNEPEDDLEFLYDEINKLRALRLHILNANPSLKREVEPPVPS